VSNLRHFDNTRRSKVMGLLPWKLVFDHLTALHAFFKYDGHCSHANFIYFLTFSILMKWLFFPWYNMRIVKASKKTEKTKKNRKNSTVKKNRLKFWKNQPVRFVFRFISLKSKKPNWKNRIKNRAKSEKPSQTSVFPKNRTGRLNRFQFSFFLIWYGYLFLIKIESNWK